MNKLTHNIHRLGEMKDKSELLEQSKILIIDGESANALHITQVLKNEGYKNITAESLASLILKSGS